MSQKNLILQEIGSFRKPEYLSSRFHKIIGTPEFNEKASKATVEIMDLFERAGLENRGVGGEMFRWEMYEHLAYNIKGIEFKGMVRSFDNRYYRKGSVTKQISTLQSAHEKELSFLLQNFQGKLKVPITGPYTMMDWSFNEHYRDRRELANAFADIIRDEIILLQSIWKKHRGNEVLEVQIDEPATTTHPSEMDIVTESVNRSIQGISGIESSIHVCYSSDYGYLFDQLPDLKVDGYNLEFANRDLLERGKDAASRPGFLDVGRFRDANEHVNEKRFLGLGVTDIHIDTVESVDLIKDRIDFSLKQFERPDLIRINPDCGLRTRSQDVGFQKLKNMADAVHSIRKEL